MAEELRKDAGNEVQIVDGARGEFTVLVDGREVAKKQGEQMPAVDKVVTAVKNAGPAAVGLRH